jgi:hypothetical protein
VLEGGDVPIILAGRELDQPGREPRPDLSRADVDVTVRRELDQDLGPRALRRTADRDEALETVPRAPASTSAASAASSASLTITGASRGASGS